MADPIEIIQSVISVSKQIYSVVKSVKNAPHELQALEREAQQVQPILGHLVETLAKLNAEQTQPAADRMQGLCDEARDLLIVDVDVTNGPSLSFLDGCAHSPIKYSCPTWFAQINGEIRADSVPLHFYIRTPRAVEGLAWLECATLDEVKEKLLSRELTVNDVQPDGYTVLHSIIVRLTAERTEAVLSIAALLAAHSAPTEWEHCDLTPTEFALWYSLIRWRRYGSRKAAIDDLKFRVGPYLSLDIEDAWDMIATKLRWTELHRRLCALPSSATGFPSIPPRLASQVYDRDTLGYTPILYAMNHSPEALRALLQAGANPSLDDEILIRAARGGAYNAIGIFVRAGAYVNIRDSQGRTALHWAASPDMRFSMNGLAVAIALVRHAGHILEWDVQDNYGDTALDRAKIRATQNPTDKNSKHILEIYRTRRIPDAIQYISSSAGDNTERGEETSTARGLPPTALIRAGLRSDVDAIGELIRDGAMVNERDQDGRTLLHLIALGRVHNGYRVALELVRHSGWGIDWDAESSRSTPCEIAIRRLDEEELDDEERVELGKIRDLLVARRLPPGEKYIWPCMDPRLSSLPEPDPELSMPGAWDDD